MKRKNKSKVVVVSLDPYDSDLVVQFGGTLESFREELKKLTKKESVLEYLEENKEHFVSKEYTKAKTFLLPLGYAMWLPEDVSVPTLAHECLHVVQELFRRVNIGCSEETDEAWAYLLEKIIKDIVKLLKF